MRKLISTVWHDPVWSGVIAILIASAIIALLALTTDWVPSVLLWLWHSVFADVWGAYFVSFASAVLAVKAWLASSASKERRKELNGENIKELARQVFAEEAEKHAKTTLSHERTSSIDWRLRQLELYHHKLKAREHLGGSYREGALHHAVEMIRIGHDQAINDGINLIEDLLNGDASFDTGQIREAVAVLEDLPAEFGGKSTPIIEKIRARPL